MSRKLFVAKNRSELEKCFPVMKELSPHLDFENYISIYEEAHRCESGLPPRLSPPHIDPTPFLVPRTTKDFTLQVL